MSRLGELRQRDRHLNSSLVGVGCWGLGVGC
jgi:hypothetical protein